MNRKLNRLRIRSIFGVLSFILFLPSLLNAQDAATNYEQAREAWLRDRLRVQTRSMILQEQVLTHRLQGILEEADRAGILAGLNLDPLLAENPPHLLSPASAPADSAERGERLSYWMLRQQEVLAEKLDAAMDIRHRLAGTATPEGLQTMFRRDLQRAVDAYAAKKHGLAAALFQELLDLYPYANLDDIRFYRAEAALADGAWDSAVEHYLVLLRTQPESAFRAPAFRHLIYLRSVFGQHATAVQECEEFAADLERSSGDVAYLCGREFFLGERFREAERILEKVDTEDPATLQARHLGGLCLILEHRFEEAIVVFEDILEHSRKKSASISMDNAFREDARLKLGYLYFEAGRFPEAAEMFQSLEKGSSRHPEALLGQAWSGLSLADPERALSLGRELVEHYPASPFRYEAMTLAGFATEQADRRQEALGWYEQVLDEARRSESMRELAAERQQILQMMRRMVEMEPRVFSGGSANFAAYQDLRRETRTLMNRVKYTELQTANESMREFIEERQQINALGFRLRELLKQGEGNSPAERQEMAALQREVRSLMSRIRLAGLVEIQRQPLMIHERTLSSVNAMLDSLAMASTIEQNRLRGHQEELSTVPGKQEDFSQVFYRERFQQLGSDVEHLRSKAAGLKRKTISSDLPRWSELAFSRLAIGDIDFDELERIEERLQELDGYMERIEDLLQGNPATGTGPPPDAGTGGPVEGTGQAGEGEQP